MKIKILPHSLLALAMMFSLCACGSPVRPAQIHPSRPKRRRAPPRPKAPSEITVTDMIGRELTVTPGSYTRVVCIGAGALRICTATSATCPCSAAWRISTTPRLRSVPRCSIPWRAPMCLPYGDVFSTLPSCGVGGPNAQAAEAEKILSCNPDIVISEYEDVEKEDALQEQLGVPVVTLKAGPNGVFDDAFSQQHDPAWSDLRRGRESRSARILHRGGDRRDRRAHRQHCRRGQARRLLTSAADRQLGHPNHLMTIPDLRLL